MNLKALDTADKITLAKAKALAALGYQAFGGYLRSDRLDLATVENLHAAGIKIFSIYERGNPTSDGYGWSYAHGRADAVVAANYAVSIHQPSGTTISPCCDYDSNPAIVRPYLEGFHDYIKTYGYYTLPYANGATLFDIIKLGYAIGGMLTQSKGFEDYAEYLAHATIQQGASFTVTGLDADKDVIVSPTIQTVDRLVNIAW